MIHHPLNEWLNLLDVRWTIFPSLLPIDLVSSVGGVTKKKETLQVWCRRPPPLSLAVVAVAVSPLFPMDAVAVAVAADVHHLLFFSLSHHSPLIIIIIIIVLIISFVRSFHTWYITNHLFVQYPCHYIFFVTVVIIIVVLLLLMISLFAVALR